MLRISCLLNLAACYLKQQQWSDCISACDKVIELDPEQPKAWFRRGQARSLPKSCGLIENKLALRDFEKARELSPTNSQIAQAYAELSKSIAKQIQSDKKTFQNFLNKANKTVYADDVEPTNKSNDHNISTAEARGMTYKDLQQKVLDMNSAANRLDLDGDRLGAHKLRRNIYEIQKIVEEYHNSEASKTNGPIAKTKKKRFSSNSDNKFDEVLKEKESDEEDLDFLHPTKEMIEAAEKDGLDLADPRYGYTVTQLYSYCILIYQVTKTFFL